MASYNRVVLVGNTTRDLELRYIPSGMAVCDMGLAVNDRRKDASGNWTEETTFVDVTLWGKTAQVAAEYAKKGTQVLIEGRLKMDTWETDGQKRSKLKVVGERLVLLGSRASGSGSGRSGGYSQGGYAQGGSQGSSQGGYGQGGYSDAPSSSSSFDGPPEISGDDVPF